MRYHDEGGWATTDDTVLSEQEEAPDPAASPRPVSDLLARLADHARAAAAAGVPF